tara:strand:+ start:819 stop:1040 length:222 start_codon:yes stop_codon:yes gene_type:complete
MADKYSDYSPSNWFNPSSVRRRQKNHKAILKQLKKNRKANVSKFKKWAKSNIKKGAARSRAQGFKSQNKKKEK